MRPSSVHRGVKGIFPLIRNHAPLAISSPFTLSSLEGIRLAIDATLLVQRLHFVDDSYASRHVIGLYRLINSLRQHGAFPIMVFDHPLKRLALKEREQLKRKQKRELDRQRNQIEVERKSRFQGLESILNQLASLTLGEKNQVGRFLERWWTTDQQPIGSIQPASVNMDHQPVGSIQPVDINMDHQPIATEIHHHLHHHHPEKHFKAVQLLGQDTILHEMVSDPILQYNPDKSPRNSVKVQKFAIMADEEAARKEKQVRKANKKEQDKFNKRPRDYEDHEPKIDQYNLPEGFIGPALPRHQITGNPLPLRFFIKKRSKLPLPYDKSKGLLRGKDKTLILEQVAQQRREKRARARARKQAKKDRKKERKQIRKQKAEAAAERKQNHLARLEAIKLRKEAGLAASKSQNDGTASNDSDATKQPEQPST